MSQSVLDSHGVQTIVLPDKTSHSPDRASACTRHKLHPAVDTQIALEDGGPINNDQTDSHPLNVTNKMHNWSSGRRILIVDDVPSLILLAKLSLELVGYQVDWCPEIRRSPNIDPCQPNCCDLLITDQFMPKMSGLDLAEQVFQIRLTSQPIASAIACAISACVIAPGPVIV